MRVLISRVNIRYGAGRIDNARSARDAEDFLYTLAVRELKKELDRILKRGGRPYAINHISEGATSLSVQERWLPGLQEIVHAAGGIVINVINVGHRIREIDDEEFRKREGVLSQTLSAQGAPPAIVMTNCFRSGTEIVFSNTLFDEKYMLVSYALDRCAIGVPVRDDLVNLLQPNTIHTVSTPATAWDVQEFLNNQLPKMSFMFLGDLGTGEVSPMVRKAEDRIDGVILIGRSVKRVKSVADSFEEKWPGRRIVAYALAPTKEEARRFSIPTLREEEKPRGWAQETFLVLFTAPITLDEFKDALRRCREIGLRKTKGS